MNEAIGAQDKPSGQGTMYSDLVAEGTDVDSYLSDQIGVQAQRKEDTSGDQGQQIQGQQQQAGEQDKTQIPQTLKEQYGLDEFGEGHPMSELENKAQAGDQGQQLQAGDQGQQAGVQGAQVLPKDDPTQFEYWQSQTDKEKGINQEVFKAFGVTDLEQFKANFSQISQLIPYASALAQNPQLLQNVIGAQSGDQAGQTQLTRPTAPEKPADYDRTEANNDPKSSSFKYRKDREQYVEDLTTYNESLNQNFESRQQSIEEDRQYASLRNSRKLEMMRDHGKSEVEAEAIVKWLESDQSVTTQNYVRLYDLSHAKPADQLERERKANEIKQQKALATEIKPTAHGAGTPLAEEIDENDAFSVSLLEHGKKVGVL
jgi:hypothetical protein